MINVSNNLLQNNRIIGNYTEYLAEKFLVKQGFLILYNNFYTRYGELDIICMRSGELFFFEIKSVSCKTFLFRKISGIDHVSCEKVAKLEKTASEFIAKYYPEYINTSTSLYVLEVIFFQKTTYEIYMYKIL